MRLGILHEKKADYPKARQVYEQILGQKPRFGPAANNLAYLYSERGGDQNKALELAQIAKEVAPDDPHVADTLGWILYKRGVYQLALSHLRESARKLPENPEIQYHLGMAAYRTGDMKTAREALGRAAAASADFGGKAEAQKTLASLR
jgi:tetratricopeptide (TPR) repeat protein